VAGLALVSASEPWLVFVLEDFEADGDLLMGASGVCSRICYWLYIKFGTQHCRAIL